MVNLVVTYSYIWLIVYQLPSGKGLHNYGKSSFLMGKLTISMVIFNSYVRLPEGKWRTFHCHVNFDYQRV